MRYLIIPFFGFVKTALTDVGTVFCLFQNNELEDRVHLFLGLLGLLLLLALGFLLGFFLRGNRFDVR